MSEAGLGNASSRPNPEFSGLCPGLVDGADPGRLPGLDVPWWVPYPVAAVALGVALVVAGQRHLFSAPDLADIAVLAAVAPWLATTFPSARTILDRHRVVAWSTFWALSTGASLWLVIGDPVQVDFAPFLLVLLTGTMATVHGARIGAAVAAGAAASLVGLGLATSSFGSQGVGIWCFAFVFTWLAGAGFRVQMQTLTELRAAQATLADRAAAEERRRLAREIHDLIAHSLAVTMLHLTGARLALGHGDQDEALEAVTEAERTGRRAMAEIRRTVGLLEGEGPDAGTAPTPTAADLPDLVRDFRAAGLCVDTRVEGDLDAVPMAVGLASYRIAQESLSNAVKHAAGAAVLLDARVTDDAFRLVITNPLPGPVPSANGSTTGDGHGLRGMSERAALLGGRVSAGPHQGSWRVEATIPVHATDS
jgi:signal transduction histidine kinase